MDESQPSDSHACQSPRPLAAVVLTVLLIALAPSRAHAGSSNSLMDVSADGTLLACSNRDSGTVTVVELPGLKKRSEVKVGRKPEGVSFLGKSHRLAVALYLDDAVAFVDADAGKVTGRAEVFDEPYGVVSNPAGDAVYVTLSYPGQVVEIDVASAKVKRSIDAGPFARGLALSPDGKRLFVTEYYTATLLGIDLAAGKVVDRWPGIASDNLSRQVTLHPTRGKAYLSHIRSAVERAQGEGSIFPYVCVADVNEPASAGKRRKRLPMDSFVGTHVTANPWESAVSADGKRFYVVFAGTDEMYACDVLDDDYREIKYRATIRLGHNPRAVRPSPDGKSFYVYNALDFEVAAYDAATLRKTGTVAVTDNPLGDELLAGKRLFYSALPPMASRRWIACSSCHVDGESDRRTWQQPEGLRDTPALFGAAWTHPLHWSADRDEAQDFEHTIRGPLMQGRGLIKGKVNPELGEPNKGLSADLDALAAYCNSHAAPLSPHAKAGLSESARRGRDLFNAKETACATCHAGPFYTDSASAGGKPLTHDVGTGNDDPTELKGSAYDTPTLLGVYKTAPYLHHGKAATLTDVLTTFNKADRHGKTSQLSAPQVADLVEFLKALPYEDPELRAKELGMKKVK